MIKKKISFLLFSALFAACAVSSEAQVVKGFYKTSYKSRNNGTFDKKTGLLSVGYGFPNLATGTYGLYNRLGFGPVYLKYEHGIMDEVGIGGYAAVAASRYKYSSNYVDKAFAFSIGAMGYYHLNKLIPIKKLDGYLGAGVAVKRYSYSYDEGYSGYIYDYNYFRVRPIFKAGARYYVAPSFSFYAETGYDDMSAMNLGITFRF